MVFLNKDFLETKNTPLSAEFFYKIICYKSERRELNPVYTHPMGTYYRYTTLRKITFVTKRRISKDGRKIKRTAQLPEGNILRSHCDEGFRPIACGDSSRWLRPRLRPRGVTTELASTSDSARLGRRR